MKVAWLLTHAEFPRTDRDFENSYTYKVFTFQFVNFYGALFYLAVVRGRASYPPHKADLESRCPISGCLVDVTIQLAVIFTGKQAINNILELGKPLFLSFLGKFRRSRLQKKQKAEEELKKRLPSWERDYHLHRNEKLLLFSDYLELLIQYGFVTMFVAAFPLAPLFAFLNNIIEIRLDAYKTLVHTQRCIPLRSNNLGPWYRLLNIVTKLAVIFNAVMIAFTTQFVDRLVYQRFDGAAWKQTHPGTEPNAAFLFYTLSTFNFSDYSEFQRLIMLTNGTAHMTNITAEIEGQKQCYYVDYRHAPDDPVDPYGHTIVWWHVLAAKLIFIILFEHFVMMFQSILAYLIPDVPKREKMRMAREKHLIQVNFLKREFGEKANEIIGQTLDDEDEEEDLVPDELPDWVGTVSPGGSTVGSAAYAKRRARRHSQNPAAADRIRRGKMVAAQTGAKKKRPFLLMLFRKLMMCD